jgi:23S rRNA pseudouridine1911/1915/1917 synthase
MNYRDLEVIYEDNHLLVLNKPAGTLSHGDKTKDQSMASLAEAYIRHTYDKPGNVFVGITHRLDRPVSGTFIVAKTSKALARLNKQFQDTKIKKTYLAISKSRPEEFSGTLTGYIKKDASKNKAKLYKQSKKGAKKAVLDYELISTLSGYNLLKVNPKTGRPHQIRVQLNDIGCTILGDAKYGHFTRWLEDKSIALHCYSMEIEHPVKKERQLFTTSLPSGPHWKVFNDLELDSLCR